jgi:hypothetical protein
VIRQHQFAAVRLPQISEAGQNKKRQGNPAVFDIYDIKFKLGIFLPDLCNIFSGAAQETY